MEKKIGWEKYLPHLIILLFAFVIYADSISNDYALDDLIVIKKNAFSQQGFTGIKNIFSYDSFTGFFGIQKKLVAGGRYRPLSIASFVVEYMILHDLNPHISHFINIILYGFTGILIYIILNMLFRPAKGNAPPTTSKKGTNISQPILRKGADQQTTASKKGTPQSVAARAKGTEVKNKLLFFGIPFMAAMLFVGHPVHTEVVANIKGRDEIFALLFSLLALWMILLFIKKNKSYFLILSGISFFLGLLSKENTIMFLVVIPLTLIFFTSVSLRKNLVSLLPLILSAILFLYIRFIVLGYINSSDLPRELLNNPFLNATVSQKIGTILYTFGIYLRLLFFPHPLTHDYYPYHIPLVEMTDPRSLIPLVLYTSLGILALIKFRKKHVLSYGIIFYMVTLFIVSNIVFSVGTFMNERFIYTPSLGFVLIVAWFLSRKLSVMINNPVAYRASAGGILLVILLLYSVKTWSRNKTWKDDFTLFSTDVRVSENSTKCNTSAGGQYFEKGQAMTDTVMKKQYFERSIPYLEKALNIYPENTNALVLLGNVYAVYKKDYKTALSKYLTVLSMDSQNKPAYANAISVLGNISNGSESDYKLKICYFLFRIDPNNSDLNYQMGKIYGQFKGNLDSAEYFLNRSVALSPENAQPYKDLGVLYGIRQNYVKALEIFQKAAVLDPKDEQVRQNIAITKKMLGQTR